eukprot:COSAG06_NODE_153_length_21876_cov_5.100628_2_plen_86_part_00
MAPGTAPREHEVPRPAYIHLQNTAVLSKLLCCQDDKGRSVPQPLGSARRDCDGSISYAKRETAPKVRLDLHVSSVQNTAAFTKYG